MGFRRAGKSVNINLGGTDACCKSRTGCKILENKNKLAQQLLELALAYNLSGFTQDWEFAHSFYWEGYNETMSYVAEVLRPHGIGLGLSINSAVEKKRYVDGVDPTGCPAYRNVPWASIL